MSLCETIRSNGDQCRAQALPDRVGCWAHDPGSREKADAARRKGGENRSTLVRATRRMPRDMKDLSRRILEAFDQVATGERAPDRAHAMARLAAVYVQLHQAGEVDARIEALEQAANGGNGTLAGLVSTYRRPS
jgi:hypothetical protein